jgi:tRNA pseudouridine55 synthase
VERPSRRIEITALRREAFAGDELVVSVECSKGTYIRTLAMELGRALGTGAYLTGLRRTAVGPFRLSDATTLDVLEADGAEAARSRLLPVEALVEGLPRRHCDAAEALRFTQGQEISAIGVPAPELAVFGPEGRFLGVACATGGRLAPLRLMATHETAQAP